MATVAVDGLTVEYADAGYRLRPLDGLGFSAGDGELVLLLGPSGCGKTTLLSCLAGILTPTAGRVVVDGHDVTALTRAGLADYRRRTVGIVFQGFNLVPSLTALENVGVPLRLAGWPRRRLQPRSADLLGLVGLADRAGHRPAQLSGGQQQRAAIARALALDPPVLLADEPTAHLDHVQVEGVVELLRRLATRGRVVVVATHDDRLLPLADRVVELAPAATDGIADPVRVELSRGEVLFAEGERSRLVYLVERGTVELVRARADGTEDLVRVAGPGSYFGETGPLLGLPRSATARARVKSVLTAYDVRDFRHRSGQSRRGIPTARRV